MILRPKACTIKHYGSVMYGLHSKVVFLFVQTSVFVQAICVCPSQNYYKTCHFSVNYGFIMFYSTGPRPFTFHLLHLKICMTLRPHIMMILCKSNWIIRNWLVSATATVAKVQAGKIVTAQTQCQTDQVRSTAKVTAPTLKDYSHGQTLLDILYIFARGNYQDIAQDYNNRVRL